MSALRVELVEEARRLGALEPGWQALWARLPAATPFQSPAWALPWWRRFHPGPLLTAAAWRGEHLVGLAPCYLEDGAHGRRVLPVGISVSDYLDVLLDPDEPAAGAALVHALAEVGDRWAVWELEELAAGAAALALPRPEGCDDQVLPQSACPVLPLAGAGVAACIPKQKMRKLRMARHRTERGGGEVERIGSEALDAFLHELVRLHGLRWRSRGEAGLLADERLRLFLEDTARAFLAAGLARLYALRIQGRIVGAYYGFLHGARAYAYFGGFDPAHAYESPGTVLLGHAIEEALREGAAEFHFLRGQEPYKYEWGAVDRWNQHRRFVRGASGDAR